MNQGHNISVIRGMGYKDVERERGETRCLRVIECIGQEEKEQLLPTAKIPPGLSFMTAPCILGVQMTTL